MEILEDIFGRGENLSTWQMSARAFVMFFLTMFYIRIAGMRSIGKKSAFDIVISIMLGAVLGRCIVGASAFFPTILAGLVLAVIHRLVAIVAMKSEAVEKVVKGQRRLLYKQGEIQWANMYRSSVSKNDLMESIRLRTNCNSLDNIEEAYIESGGEISVVLKSNKC